MGLTSHELTRLLSDAVDAVIDLAARHGYRELPVAEYEVRWLEQVDPSHGEGRSETRNEPSFSVVQWQLRDEIAQEPAVGRLELEAREFIRTEGKVLPTFSFLSNPADRLLGIYFGIVGALKLDANVAERVAAQFIEDLSSPVATVRLVFQVERFEAPGPFDLADGISLRPISKDNIDEHGRLDEFRMLTSAFPRVSTSDWICECKGSFPKDTMEPFNDFRRDAADLICAALNLTKGGRALFTLLSDRMESAFLVMGTGRNPNPVASASTGDKLTLTSENVVTAQTIFSAVEPITTGDSLKYLRLAFRRLRAAASRTDRGDQLVDYVIALESLLATDSLRLETTFRIRLRGAALLSSRFGSPRERMSLLARIYDLRSKVVHGNADIDKVLDILPQAEDVLRDIFVWYLLDRRGHRSVESIRDKLDEELVSGGERWARGTEASDS
jgi:hypothetical protein